MKINIENAEKLFDKALKLLNGHCPKQEHTECPWCQLIKNEE